MRKPVYHSIVRAGHCWIRKLTGCLVLILIPIWTAAAGEPETWHIDGTTYTNVRVREVTPGTITIFHSRGIAQLEIADLPTELQERFSYDPRGAEEWRQEVQEERLAQVAHRIEGRKKKKPDSRFAWLLRNNPWLHSPDQVEIRPEVDLRPRFREYGLYAKHQGRRPSCSVFAVVSALEYNLASRKRRIERLSEEYLIWATLKVRPGINIDTGFNFSEVLRALQKFGIPPSDTMPNTFGKKINSIKPTREAISAAQPYRNVTPVLFLQKDPELLRRIIGALNEDNPVIIGVRWPHWRSLQKNNLIRNQKPAEGASHAVTLVGYRSPDGTAEGTTFIFRNSYGQKWGVGGCGFMAASYLQENLLSALYLDIP